MADYTPIDLTAFHNAELTFLGEQGIAPIGLQQFRGLPFLVGTNPHHCFVAFGNGLQEAPLSIHSEVSVGSVIVAHRLLNDIKRLQAKVGDNPFGGHWPNPFDKPAPQVIFSPGRYGRFRFLGMETVELAAVLT
jgi:hypothetical protein